MTPTKSARSNTAASPLGFEATAMRVSASFDEVILRILSLAKNNRCLAAA